MGRVVLEGYVPFALEGRSALCCELGPESLVVDLAEEHALESGQELDGELFLSPRARVRARLVIGDELPGAPVDFVRYHLTFQSFEGSSEATLVAYLSARRKDSHLDIVASRDVEAAQTRAGWARWRLPHLALPDARPEDIDLETRLLGHKLAAPLVISGMTGGTERAGKVNRNLARTAQELGLAMGLGSQRAMLEDESLAASFQVRDLAPDILLLANIGAVQLNKGVGVSDCQRLVEAVDADVLAVHLNPLQEMVQPEGDRDWRALRPKLEALIAAVGVPVVLKETGCGLSAQMAAQARDMVAAGIDIGGTGGTAWGWIEGFRSSDPQRQEIGETFREWGIPSAVALAECRAELGSAFPIIATGGVRNGVDVATALALGADVAGMALPFFRAADLSADETLGLGRRVLEELRIAMLCCGARDTASLRQVALTEVR